MVDRTPTYEIAVIEKDLGSTATKNSFDAVMIASGGAVEEIQDFERQFLKAADLYSRGKVHEGDRVMHAAKDHARLARVYAGLAAYANRINYLLSEIKRLGTPANAAPIAELRRVRQSLRASNPGVDVDAWEATMRQVLLDPTFREYDRNSISAREFEKCLLEVEDSVKRVARLSNDFRGTANFSRVLSNTDDEEELSGKAYFGILFAGIAALFLVVYATNGGDS